MPNTNTNQRTTAHGTRLPRLAAIAAKADSHTSEAARTGWYGGCRESTRSMPSSARLAVGIGWAANKLGAFELKTDGQLGAILGHLTVGIECHVELGDFCDSQVSKRF